MSVATLENQAQVHWKSESCTVWPGAALPPSAARLQPEVSASNTESYQKANSLADVLVTWSFRTPCAHHLSFSPQLLRSHLEPLVQALAGPEPFP